METNTKSKRHPRYYDNGITSSSLPRQRDYVILVTMTTGLRHPRYHDNGINDDK